MPNEWGQASVLEKTPGTVKRAECVERVMGIEPT